MTPEMWEGIVAGVAPWIIPAALALFGWAVGAFERRTGIDVPAPMEALLKRAIQTGLTAYLGRKGLSASKLSEAQRQEAVSAAIDHATGDGASRAVNKLRVGHRGLQALAAAALKREADKDRAP